MQKEAEHLHSTVSFSHLLGIMQLDDLTTMDNDISKRHRNGQNHAIFGNMFAM
jgi:hypothetical protein